MSFLFEIPRKEETIEEIKRKLERLVTLLEDASLEFAIKDPVSGELVGNMKGVIPRVTIIDRVRASISELNEPGETVSIDKATPSVVSGCLTKIKQEQPEKMFKSVGLSETETLIVRVK